MTTSAAGALSESHFRRPTASRRSVLLASLGLAAGAGLIGCSSSPGQLQTVTPQRSWAPRPQQIDGLQCLARQRGDQIVLHTAGGDVTFWGGVNLGSAVPGHSPGELALRRDDYVRWFGEMGSLGVRFVRIYTIHPPHMYEELDRYNREHEDAPIYLVQGIYLPDESYIEKRDLYDAAVTKGMIQEVRDASAAVRGTLKRPNTPGRARGTWTTDVSRWLAAWLVGVEWDPDASNVTDTKHAKAPKHRGRFFSSSKDATATESWIAARLDELATIEAAQGTSVPIAAVNWPATDPLKHPQEPSKFEDLVSVDANHIECRPAWPGGTFASYHAYPNFPDFLAHQPDYQSSGDPYRAYLEDLKRHHRNMPLLITEFGVPSSLGMAHHGTNGRDQGFLNERDAMRFDADMLQTIKAVGAGGGFLFKWVDEWFKSAWNTLPRTQPVSFERRSLWQDPLNNELFYGLVATVPTRVGQSTPYENTTGLQRVDVDLDASYVYLSTLFEQSLTGPVRVGFDILPGSGRALPGTRGEPVYDVCVLIDPQASHATAYVDSAVDPITLDSLIGKLPGPDLEGWSIQRLTLNRAYTVPGTGERVPMRFAEVGRLVSGSWDPEDEQFDSRATWRITPGPENEGTLLRLRLPWSMLMMADPSSRTALLPRDGKPTGVAVEKIETLIDAEGQGRAAFPVRWDAWNRVSYSERFKVGAQQMVDALDEVNR